MIRRLPASRTSRSAVVLTLLALSVAGAGLAFATSLTVTSSRLTGWDSPASCTPATVTLSAEADSYVDEASATSNFGTQTSLKVKAPLLGALGIDLGGDRAALARFTLPERQLCSVTLAKLRLYASSAASGRTIEVRRITGSWTEGAVTWNNQPATTGTDAATAASGSGAGYREWTVTAQVAAMYSATNNGFYVDDISGLSLLAPEQIYDSREAGANHPELVLTLA